jgi:hypothetical protein
MIEAAERNKRLLLVDFDMRYVEALGKFGKRSQMGFSGNSSCLKGG